VYLPDNPQAGMHIYGYDDAGRLTSWRLSATTIAYEWDGAGNRITAGSGSYTYDHRNRLVSGPDGTYTYTPRGTLASIDNGATTVTYGFDPLGRMVDYNGEAAFSYDGLDRVAERNSVGFTYTGMMLDPAGDGSFTYSRSPAGRLMSQTDGATALLTGLDRHGDLTWLADPATGQITDTAMYDPYGDPTATRGSTLPTVGFQGDYTDPASGEVWMGARWYSGADAVFRSRDTVFGELNTPISLNRYTYGWANPLSYWDPDGRYVEYIPGLDGPALEGKLGDVYEMTHRTTSEGNHRRADDLARRLIQEDIVDNMFGFIDMGDRAMPASELAAGVLSLWLYKNVYTVNTTQLWLQAILGDSYADKVGSDSLLAEPWFEVLAPEYRNGFAYAEVVGGTAGLAAALSSADWSDLRLETDQPAHVCNALSEEAAFPCTSEIIEWWEQQADGYDYGSIASTWYHSEVEPAIFVSALALEAWLLFDAYAAYRAVSKAPVRPQPGDLGAAQRPRYEPAPYHRGVQSGQKNPAPVNGQEALDFSIPISPNTSRRVGIDYQTGAFVVFDETMTGVFHGHVRTWNELTQRMQAALRTWGFVDKRGNIMVGG
jgi:RHS repeat-associated protein